MGWKLVPSTPEQTQARTKQIELMEANLQFPTRQVPGMTGAEEEAQSLLAKYMASGTPEGYTMGMQALMDAVKGSDPSTSPYYQALKAESLSEEERAAGNIRRGGQIASGTPFHSPNIGQEAKMRTDFAMGRESILQSLIDKERDRQLNAAGPLMSAADYMSQEPLRKAQAGMTLGALPRQLQTEQESAVYEAILNELLAPYMYQAPIMGSISNEQRYYYKSKQQSGLGGALGSGVGGILGAVVGNMIAPGMGGMLVGSMAGGSLGGGVGNMF